MLETNEPADFREPHVHYEDVATITSAPNRPFGIRRVQLAVTRHQLTTRRKISLSVVDGTAFALVDPEDYPHPCGARRLPNSL